MSTDLTSTIYNNPLLIQEKILDNFEATLNSEESIIDGNNVFCFLAEQFATLTAESVNAISDTFDSLYASRSQTMSDLYRHMSDYDSLSLFSSPATCTIRLQLNKDYLWNNAETYDNGDGLTHKRVTIPEDSVFQIGSYFFGINYPINIEMSLAGDSSILGSSQEDSVVAVVYDTSNGDNPLQTLQYNSLTTVETTNAGSKYIGIKIPLYQFVKDTYTEDLTAVTGFSKTYSYANSFYVIRVFTNTTNSSGDTVWTELNLTMSEDIYSTSNPTVKFAVEPDLNQVKVTIPQVFFTEGLLGTKLKVLIYNTLGALDVDLSTVETSSINAAILHDTTYSAIFSQIPQLAVTLISSKISGGSNGSTFEEFKQLIINRTDSRAKITDGDLTEFFKQNGYTFHRYEDGITNRIYKARSVFTNKYGTPIAIGTVPTQYDMQDLLTIQSLAELNDASDASIEARSIWKNIVFIPNDNSMVILPSMLYSYDAIKNACVPAYVPSNPSDAELNDNQYTFSPFHIRLDYSNTYPSACAYDLSNPQFQDLVHMLDTSSLVTQLNVIEGTVAAITYTDDNGVLQRGYRITMIVSATSDLDDATFGGDNPDVILYLKATSAGGTTGYLLGELKTAEGSLSQKTGDYYIFTAIIDCSYIIKRNHTMGLKFIERDYTADERSYYDFYDMEFDLNIEFLVRKSFISDAELSLSSSIPDNSLFVNDYYSVMRQKATIKLGGPITYLGYSTSVLTSSSSKPVYPSDELAVWTNAKYEVIDGVLTKVADSNTPINATLPIMLTFKELVSTTTVVRSIQLLNVNQIGPYANAEADEDDSDSATTERSMTIWSGSSDGTTYSIIYTKSGSTAICNIQRTIGATTTIIATANASADLVTDLPLFNGVLWPWEVEFTAPNASITELEIYKDVTFTDGDIKHVKGSIVAGSYAEKLWNKYVIEQPQIDAKFLYSTTDGNSFATYCQNLFRTHIDKMETMKQSLLANTKLWYEPVNSLGNTKYILSNTERLTASLAITIAMRIFVSQDIASDAVTTSSIKERIQAIVDSHFETSLISCAKIAKDILSNLGDVVNYVDILGINGDPSLQTLIGTDKYASPHVKHIIETSNGNVRNMGRALEIEFVALGD